VAAKLQYPDMASALEADLNQLKLVFAVGQRFDPAIRTDEIHAEITTRLREELDYRREAKHVALYRHMLRDEPDVHVPEVVPSHSTDRLLTMTWLQGEPLLNWKSRSQEEKDQLAIHMFRAWYVPFYVYGVIHGDPHLGNYTVRPDGSVNLMDFGCVRIFPPRFVRGSIELYRALMTDDQDRAVAAYEDWGFTGLSREMIAVLNRWAAFLYGPLMDDRPRRLTEGMADGHGREMAQNVFGELRRMGGVRPPREFVFMDRAAIGLGAVFIHLRASINWHRLFESLIEGFDVDALARRQQVALTEAGL
jgi:predicted unusual protein kinase regulating ubiquinone biosynthesis (AarF/ABC1/UbiB family)